MFWLWLIVAVLVIAVGVYLVGRSDLYDDEKSAILWTGGFGALGWPIVLVVAIIIGPFVGLYWLGDRHRMKKEKSTDNK